MVLTFVSGEEVICKSEPEASYGYPAKVTTVERDAAGRVTYGIHFKGWAVRYDIEVTPDQVEGMMLKYTKELEDHHVAMHKEQLKESKKDKKKKVSTDNMPATERKKRKIEREGSADSSQSGDQEKMMKGVFAVNIPDKLRGNLMDDNDLVVRQGKLVKLPAQFTVNKIMKDYRDQISADSKLSDVSGNDEMLVEYGRDTRKSGRGKGAEVVLNKHDMVQSSLGVLDYFNVLLGHQLLYQNERSQYESSCCTPGKNMPGEKVDKTETPELENLHITPSSIYGFPHLLRLFVKIGPMIKAGTYGDKSINIIMKHVNDCIVFLSKNSEKYFDIERDYVTTVKTD